MISIEQIRELNHKVQSTLEVIKDLREENALLHSKLKENETRVKDLELLVSSFRNDQHEIEEGLKAILLQLDHLEDGVVASHPSPGGKNKSPGDTPPSGEKDDSSKEKGYWLLAGQEDSAGIADGSDTASSSSASDGGETASSPTGGKTKAKASPSDDVTGIPTKDASKATSASKKTPEADAIAGEEDSESPSSARNADELELF